LSVLPLYALETKSRKKRLVHTSLSVSTQRLTEEAQVCAQDNPFVIPRWQHILCPCSSVFPCHYHSTTAPYSLAP
jgi:hypothetical protein